MVIGLALIGGVVLAVQGKGDQPACVSNIFKRRCYWSEPKRQKDTENDTEKDTEQPKSSSASELVPILAPRRASKDGCRFRCILLLNTVHNQISESICEYM